MLSVALLIVAAGSGPFADDFESGAFGPCWQARGVIQGRTRVISDGGPARLFHAVLDTRPNGRASRSELTLRVDTGPLDDAVLRWASRNYGGGNNSVPATWRGSIDATGVGVSDDGVNWIRVSPREIYRSPDGQFFFEYRLSGRSLSPSPTLFVRFMYFGTGSAPYRGRAIDNVQVGRNLADFVPPVGTIVIDDDALTTTSPQVRLTLTATDAGGGTVTDMQFSNDGSAWSPWEPLASTRMWNLDDPRYGGDANTTGPRLAQVRFRDSFGNVSSRHRDRIDIVRLPSVVATPPFHDDFEQGRLQTHWQRYEHLGGRVTVTSSLGASSGQFALRLHEGVLNFGSRADVVLTADLTGLNNVWLTFFHQLFDAEVHISNDGADWHRIGLAPRTGDPHFGARLRRKRTNRGAELDDTFSGTHSHRRSSDRGAGHLDRRRHAVRCATDLPRPHRIDRDQRRRPHDDE